MYSYFMKIEVKVSKYMILIFGFVLSLFYIKAQPAVVVHNCIQTSPDTYTCNLDPNAPFVYMNIYNSEVPYNVTISYSGVPTALYLMGNYFGSGSSYSKTVTITTTSTPLQLSVSQSGTGVISFLFTPVSYTGGLMPAYNYKYTIIFNLGTTTSQQNITTTTGNVTTSNQTITTTVVNVSNPLTPLYTYASFTLYTNQTYEYPIGVINTGNTNLTILNILVEGLPPQNAYVKGQVGTLSPGDYAYMKLVINTYGMPPGQYNIVVSYTAKSDNQIYNAQTTITLYVISSLGQNVTQQSQQPLIPTITKLPLQVNYSITSGYLFIQGAYVVYNGSIYYVPTANILVIGPNGQALSYYYPIPVVPGQTYCIYAYEQNYVPFFSCIQSPPRPLCYLVVPKGQTYGDKVYYVEGTNITVQSVYDCNSLQPILGATFYYNGIPTYSTTFQVQKGQNVITISAPGYSLTNITVYGYTPITVSNLPATPGEYTIRAEGDFADQAQLTLYQYINGTRVQVSSGTGSLTYNFTVGQYELQVSGPLINETTYIIYISPPYIPQPKSTFDFVEWLINNILYIIIAFLVFTLISVILYRRSGSRSVTELAEEITKEIRKQ
jgi:hypothetical protein